MVGGHKVRLAIPYGASSPILSANFQIQRPRPKKTAVPGVFTGRKSSGLGLCFVREAAALHGGGIHVENRPTGSGARAILTLPMHLRPGALG